MSKLKALEELLQELDKQALQQVDHLAFAVTHKTSGPTAADLIQVGELRGELAAHVELLGYAGLACELGQAGEVPDNWDERRPFDPYALLLEALGELPHHGQLSQRLLDYLDELPRRKQLEHDQTMTMLREDMPENESGELLAHALLDLFEQLTGRPAQGHMTALLARRQAGDTTPAGNPLRQLTEQELGRFSLAVAAKHTLATAFTVNYAADLARAQELALQRGDWAAILDCL